MNNDNKHNLGALLFKTEKPGWKRSSWLSALFAIVFGCMLVALLVFALPGYIHQFSSTFVFSLIITIILIVFCIFLLHIFLTSICMIINLFVSHVSMYENGLIFRVVSHYKFPPTIIFYEDIVEVEFGNSRDAMEMLGVAILSLNITRKDEKIIIINQDDVSIEKLNLIKAEIEKRRKIIK